MTVSHNTLTSSYGSFCRLNVHYYHSIDEVLTHENLLKTGDRYITQIANINIDLNKFVELTADVRKKYKILL